MILLLGLDLCFSPVLFRIEIISVFVSSFNIIIGVLVCKNSVAGI